MWPRSVLIRAGETINLCTASIDESLPPWMKKDQDPWLGHGQYNMLPGSTAPMRRESGPAKSTAALPKFSD